MCVCLVFVELVLLAWCGDVRTKSISITRTYGTRQKEEQTDSGNYSQSGHARGASATLKLAAVIDLRARDPSCAKQIVKS
jgi:hypothetical protein